jgi:hypothetical protein
VPMGMTLRVGHLLPLDLDDYAIDEGVESVVNAMLAANLTPPSPMALLNLTALSTGSPRVLISTISASAPSHALH